MASLPVRWSPERARNDREMGKRGCGQTCLDVGERCSLPSQAETSALDGPFQIGAIAARKNAEIARKLLGPRLAKKPGMRDVAQVPVAPKSWSFEPTGRLVHLRWAVAEINIGIETPSAALDAAERALKIFSQRAVALIEALDSDSDALADACYTAELGIADARNSLAQ